MFWRLSKVGRWYELVIQDKHVLGEFETEKKHSVGLAFAINFLMKCKHNLYKRTTAVRSRGKSMCKMIAVLRVELGFFIWKGIRWYHITSAGRKFSPKNN